MAEVEVNNVNTPSGGGDGSGAGSLLVGLLVVLLLAVLAWASLQVWLARVLLDVLPPGSG